MSDNAGFFGTLGWLCIALLIGAATIGILHWSGRWDEMVRQQVQAELARMWPHLRLSIRAARHISGKGFEVRGLELTALKGSATPTTLLTVDELLISCASDWIDFVQGNAEVLGIVVRRPALRFVRSGDEEWSWKLLQPQSCPQQRAVPIRILRGTIELVDTSSATTRSWRMYDVEGTIRPRPAAAGAACRPFRLEASWTGEQCRRCAATWRFESAEEWQATVTASAISLSAELFQALPRRLANWNPHVNALQGVCSLRWHAERRPAWDAPRITAEGRLSDGRFFDQRLAFPLSELQARFRYAGQQFHVDRFSCRYGEAYLTGAAVWPISATEEARVEGSVEQLRLDAAFARQLPPNVKGAYQAFAPRGDVDAQFRFLRQNGCWQPHIEAHCREVSFAWQRIPIPIDKSTGSVVITPQRLSFDVTGFHLDRPVHLRGEIQEPGPVWTGWCNYETQRPVPLDERLISTLPTRLQQAIRQLEPQGMIRLSGRASRQRAKDAIQFQSFIDVSDATVNVAAFPYPLHQVAGQIEQQGNRWVFRHFTGKNDSGQFRVDGQWTSLEDRGGQLELTLSGTQVPLEAELRAALSSSAQEMWQELRPNGMIDHMTVDYSLDTRSNRQSMHIMLDKQAASGSPLTLYPRSFPYRLEEVSGRVEFDDGKIALQHIRGRHGRVTCTADGSAEVAADGTWRLHFSQLLADRCRPDRDLLAALPFRLRRFLQVTAAAGEVTLQGNLLLQGDLDIPTTTKAWWDFWLDVEDGSLISGLSLQQTSGIAHLAGRSDAMSFQCHGDVAFDSVMADGVHATHVRGPFYADQDRVLLGKWVPPAERRPPRTDHPPGLLRQVSASASRASPTPKATPAPLTGRALGGVVALDAEIDPNDDGDFRLQVVMEEAELEQVSRDLMPSTSLRNGNVSAAFRLSGNSLGRSSWNGSGHVELRKANLYELPVMLVLLKQLRTGSQDRSAFDAADLDVRLQGEHLYFDRIDFLGDAITLKGVGQMNMRRELDLHFYTVMGREDAYVPAIRPLLGLASQRILLVRVLGTVEDPETYREVLPGLNQTIQQLFPDLTTSESTSR